MLHLKLKLPSLSLLSFLILGSFASSAEFPRGSVIIETERLTSYQKHLHKNLSMIDWSNPTRNQGAIGSCQSFAFLGLVENSVYQDQGVSVDLSERYQLYANFVYFGALGSKPEHTARLPEVIAKFGSLPEAIYPYEIIEKNHAVFQLDSAQGLESNHAPMIDQAIDGLSESERSKVLQDPRFLGPLPEGELPIALPVVAKISPTRSNVRWVQNKASGLEAPCFSAIPMEPSLSISPDEFARHCLNFRETEFELSGLLTRSDDIHNFCTKNKTSSPDSFDRLVRSSKESLLRVLSGLTAGKASLVAIPVPDSLSGKKSVVWHSSMTTYAGHAVVALGYLTASD